LIKRADTDQEQAAGINANDPGGLPLRAEV
jgi:hypothetical protein